MAQGVGARALVVVNSEDDYRLYMSAPDDAAEMPDIPVLIIAKSDGDRLIDEWKTARGRPIESVPGQRAVAVASAAVAQSPWPALAPRLSTRPPHVA